MLNFRTLTIFRLLSDDESGDEYGRELQNTSTYLTGFLAQASPQFSALVDGDYGRTFTFATDDFDTDIRIGDELRDPSDGCARYQVKGVDTASDGPGRKRQLTLTKAIQQ